MDIREIPTPLFYNMYFLKREKSRVWITKIFFTVIIAAVVTIKSKRQWAKRKQNPETLYIQASVTWCFSDRASWIDYVLITNLMHWLLFIHKILFSSTCFEPQVFIFRRIQLYTCSIWYCHSHREWQYHVEENNILWINNNQCIKLVINIYIYKPAICEQSLRFDG